MFKEDMNSVGTISNNITRRDREFLSYWNVSERLNYFIQQAEL